MMIIYEMIQVLILKEMVKRMKMFRKRLLLIKLRLIFGMFIIRIYKLILNILLSNSVSNVKRICKNVKIVKVRDIQKKKLEMSLLIKKYVKSVKEQEIYKI